MVDDSAKSGMVKRARRERRRKRRWLPGGRWRTPSSPPFSVSLFFLQFPIPRSSTYIPADTARCSCFYHYCYYNFGGWTSDEPMRRLSGWERYERHGEGAGEGRRDPAAGRERERKTERQEVDAKDGPSGEDKMVKKRKKKWLPSEGRTARKEQGFHRGFRGWPPGNL